MASDRTGPKQLVITEADVVDLSRAGYAPALAGTGLEQADGLFYATWDRVVFGRTIDVVSKVLTAHGFALNLENMLSSIDQIQVAARVTTTGKPSAKGQEVAKGFMPALAFRLPKKNQVGPLLAKFYSEIEAYEAELARLQGRRGGQAGEKEELARLRKEVERLERESQNLQAKVVEQNQRITELQRSQANSAKALAAQNYLPSNVRSATVHEVDLKTRDVVLKSGRKVFDIPLVVLQAMPEEGESALVSLRDGNVVGVFFYEQSRPPPQVQLAEVLNARSGACKIRDDSRRTRVIEAQNPAESDILGRVRRGDRLLLYIDRGELIRFEPCVDSDPATFGRAVQGSIAIWQAGRGGNGGDAAGGG